MNRNNRRFRLLSWLAPLVQWWRADQVRISPRQGRMLRIEAPCLLEIDGERWFVESRESRRDHRGPWIRYRCRNEKDRESEIRAFPPLNGEPQNLVLWIDQGLTRRLDENRVGVYPLSRSQRRPDWPAR